jgi:hypothetical protein
MKNEVILASGTAVALLGTAICAHAQYLNGTLDSAFYGTPLAVQTVNTGFGNSPGGGDATDGSELDAGYGQISGGDLYLFLAGDFQNNGNHLNIFISGGLTGQSTLAAPATGTLQTMNGSVFSPTFQATYAIDLNDYNGTAYVEEYSLTGTPAGGYVGDFGLSSGIGSGSPDGGSIQYYLNNTHASTMGTANQALSGATSGANTTTGLELSIPLSVLGYGGGSINVLADINGGGDDYLSNQFLSGLPVGSGNLGNAGVFSFGSTPNEYFTVSSVPEPSTLALFGLSGLMTILALRRR